MRHSHGNRALYSVDTGSLLAGMPAAIAHGFRQYSFARCRNERQKHLQPIEWKLCRLHDVYSGKREMKYVCHRSNEARKKQKSIERMPGKFVCMTRLREFRVYDQIGRIGSKFQKFRWGQMGGSPKTVAGPSEWSKLENLKCPKKTFAQCRTAIACHYRAPSC